MSRFLQRILPIFLYSTIFLASLYQPVDPDLGWHLRYGEYFFHHLTILRDNTFSTIMPTFQWANGSWGTDVITYAVYHMGGFLGLTILSASIVTLTCFVFAKAANLSLWDQAILLPFLLYLEIPVNNNSFRGQQISLLLTGIVFYLIHLYKKNPKVILLTIPLFFLWANLHEEFFLGWGLFFGWVIVFLGQKILTPVLFPKKTLQFGKQKKKESFRYRLMTTIFLFRKEAYLLFSVCIVSALVTIINPYGVGIHLDALSHFNNPLLKTIVEYLPFSFLSQQWIFQVVVAVLLTAGLINLYFHDRVNEYIPVFCMSLLVFILSFFVRRYAWPAYYLTLPFLQPLTNFIKPPIKKIIVYGSTAFSILFFALTVTIQYPFTQFQTTTWNTYCQIKNPQPCSPQSANFLIQHHLTNNLFSLYGWGGWLIWNYPQIKPVIDGRMHLWKDEHGYSGFAEYYGLEQNILDINKTTYTVVYMSPDKPLYHFLLKQTQTGKWILVYQDKAAGIFVKSNHKT